jgi:hypothetical protein
MNKLQKLSLSTLIIVAFFSVVFYQFDNTHWIGISKEDDQSPADKLFNRVYFTMTTFSSTGYGDISPKSKGLKVAVMLVQFLITISILDFIV